METITVEPARPAAIPEGKLVFAAVNSGLNGLATLLLIAAFIAIRKRKYRAHGTLMVTALAVSAVFLISYLLSKILYGEVTSEAVTGGRAPGWAVGLYLAVLFPHLVAAMAMLPMIFLAVYHAARRNWEKHRRIATPTWYIWVYVSISGVAVYWMLYHWLPSYAAVPPPPV